MVGRSAILAAGMAGLFLLLLALLGLPGTAQGPRGAAPTCYAYSDTLVSMRQAERQLDWKCGAEEWEDGRGVTWLRFDDFSRSSPPHLFTSRVTVFESLAVAVVDESGSVRIRSYRQEQVKPLLAGPLFGVELPAAGPEARAFIVRVEAPHSVTVASEAQLRQEPLTGVDPVALVLLSLVAGMLVMPLLFDIMYYLVLRERFVLCHAGMVLSMIVYVMSAGGVVTAFALVPVDMLAVSAPLSWTLGSAFAGLFITAFLEEDMLPRRLYRTVNVLACAAALGAGFCALQLEWTQSFDNQFYFIMLAPILPAYLAAIAVALWRGSRAARYLAFAFVPIFATGTERLLRGIGYYAAPSSIDHALFFALGLEAIIISLGVADRFLLIRRERDQAVVRAKTLKQLSERDSLTGLLNRRVIEDRFTMLRQEGFTALAVIDLDHFKRINDTFGHAQGDLVLKAVGKALQGDDADAMAFRMGGEEFLLLLRGSDAVQRAEKQRQEIARRVAQEDLGCLVTASMGIVEVTGGALPGASFATIYARADRLLYEAKAAGRNRMVCERIKAFQPRRGERRAA
jgi:diguanylate cyclase (GGDEF)-like protein